MEKAPLYTLGNANPRSFSRGKRGIAGSMVFTLFDRSALYQIIHDGKHHYYRHEYEPPTIATSLSTTPGVWTNYDNILNGISVDNTGQGGEKGAPSSKDTGVGTVDTVKTTAEYLDQIMPLIYQAA